MKKEDFIKVAALYGREVSCAINTQTSYGWENCILEVNADFLMDFEKGNIKGIIFPTTVSEDNAQDSDENIKTYYIEYTRLINKKEDDSRFIPAKSASEAKELIIKRECNIYGENLINVEFESCHESIIDIKTL